MGISTSLLAAFFVGFLRFVPSVQSCLSTVTSIKANLPSIDRINNMLRESGLSLVEDRVLEIENFKKITIQNLTFKYEKKDEYIFNKANLKILKNKMYWHQGLSGTGKTIS